MSQSGANEAIKKGFPLLLMLCRNPLLYPAELWARKNLRDFLTFRLLSLHIFYSFFEGLGQAII